MAALDALISAALNTRPNVKLTSDEPQARDAASRSTPSVSRHS